jgi:hypothetical protein
LFIGDEADRAAAEHFPSQDDMDAAMEDFLKQLGQEVTFNNLNTLLAKLPIPPVSAPIPMTLEDAIAAGFLPKLDLDAASLFSASELKLYKHATECKWTAEELRKTIELIKSPDFKPEEIDTDMHQRMAKALRDGYLKSFDMRESSRDGDQDLHMYLREMDVVIRELIGDPRMAGILVYTSVN